MSELFDKITQAVYDGDADLMESLADEVIDQKIDMNDAINLGGLVGLEKLGKAFDNLEVFLPELMLGGEAMQVLIDKLTPYLSAGTTGYAGKIIIGTAQGDLHDIGMQLVATQLSVNGYKVIRLGTDVSVKKFMETAEAEDADIIAISSLLTTSAYYQEELIKRLISDGKRDKYKIIVGGGPITPDWAKQIGADGYSRTANLAVELCNNLMKSDHDETLILE